MNQDPPSNLVTAFRDYQAVLAVASIIIPLGDKAIVHAAFDGGLSAVQFRAQLNNSVGETFTTEEGTFTPFGGVCFIAEPVRVARAFLAWMEQSGKYGLSPR